MGTPAGTGAAIPSLENRFGYGRSLNLDIEFNTLLSQNRLQATWKNPYLPLIITPHIPTENDEKLIAAWEIVIKESLSLGSLSPEHLYFSHLDITASVLSKLDLKNMLNASSVCKCFYLASKYDLIWKIQVSNLLPSLQIISQQNCSFSPEQQFKIIYKRINEERKPYKAKLERNQVNSLRIKSEIDEISKYATNAMSHPYYIEHIRKKAQVRQLSGATSGGTIASIEQIWKKEQLKHLSGAKYDGTIASIVAPCAQAILLKIIEVLIPAEFNKQDKFAKAIQDSESLKNANSPKSSVVIEDVTNSSKGSKS